MEGNIRSYRTRVFFRKLIFSDGFVKKCKDNVNEVRFIPLEVQK